jgi:transcriptional regulator with XRE-family HTH domain
MTWRTKAKALMADQKIKQKDLLDVFNVSTRGAIGHYLKGRRQPCVEQLNALAIKLGCSINELIEDPTPEELDENDQITEDLSQYNPKLILKPQIIDLNSWQCLTPQVRALVEDIIINSKTGLLKPENIPILHGMLNALSSK